MGSAFSKIAKPAESSGTKKTTKIAAAVTPTIKARVDSFVYNKADIDRLEAENKEIEAEIIEHVRAQQDELAFKGEFTKSLTVAGNATGVTYVTTDKFSVPQDEDSQKAIKTLLGAKTYGQLFTERQSISLKASVVSDEATLNKIASACEKAGLPIGDIFDVGVRVVATDGLDEKQYTLEKDKLPAFRSLVRQNKPSLRKA